MSAPAAIVAGLACACPACGKGRLFSGFLTVAERCPECGLELARNDTGDGPAVFLIFVIGFLVVPVSLLISLHVDWPLWLHALVWGGAILGMALGLLRPAKAYVIALQYRYARDSFGAPPGDG